jgi:hypothetical protein
MWIFGSGLALWGGHKSEAGKRVRIGVDDYHGENTYPGIDERFTQPFIPPELSIHPPP